MGFYLDFLNEYIMGSIQMLISFHFLMVFLKKRISLIYRFLFVLFGNVLLMAFQNGSVAEFLAYVLLHVFIGICICRADGISAILYSVITVETMQLCFGVINSVLCILYPMAGSFHNWKTGVIFMVLGNTALILAVLCYFIINKYFSYNMLYKNMYTIMILTPAVMIFLIGKYINSVCYGNTITTDRKGNILNANHFLMLAIQLLGMASLFCIMFAYKKLLENFYLSRKLSLLEQEEHFPGQYVEEAKAHYDKTKSFRHDIKNHMVVIKELLQNGKLEKALDYIGDIGEMGEGLSFPCSTGNPVVDILVGNKLGLAKSAGIDVSCSLMIPYPCAVRDIDFCIILSNALDNAICACKNIKQDDEKYIHIQGRIQGDFIMLEVENSFMGHSLFRQGTGLSNIKAVAEKYNGAMSVKVQDMVFVLNVLLIIPRQ